MSIRDIMDRWVVQTGRMSRPKIAAFCGLPDPAVLKQALATHDMVVMLVYRPFGKSARKVEWRRPKQHTYMNQYWRRVWVKVGEVDKKRIQVFCVPIKDIRSAPVLLEGIINGFKNYQIVSQYELKKTDDETQLDTLKTMTYNYLKDK